MKAALREDVGRGDLTTAAIVGEAERCLGVIFSKEDGVLCGVDIARRVFSALDSRVEFDVKLKDGDDFSTGATIAAVIGPAAACLTGERTALNFLQRLSGIATLTRKYVLATEGRIKILDTRKTAPGLRILEKYAVRTGGAENHRSGLYDMVLIKDNHIQIAGSIARAVAAVREKRRRGFIEVEVKTMDEVREAVDLNVNRIMLDNMRTEAITQAVALIKLAKKKIEVEISGGVNLDNIRAIVDSGADYVSIGAITHSAPAIDIAMKMKSLGR